MAAVAGLLLPASASAAFHFMKIREVHAGGPSGGSYVVLQMHSNNQNFVGGHEVVVYGPGGAAVHTFTFPSHVGNGANQATILVAGGGYEAAFPSGPTPDASDTGLDIPAAGGAVCFENIDCVSWGDFVGDTSLPSPAGTPASPTGVTADRALHRSIAATCSTLLEFGDDSNRSAIDFSEQGRKPRNNALAESPIVEEPCSGPSAAINAKPAHPSNSDNAAFTYESPSPSATFECWLDGDPFEGCEASGVEYAGLAAGEHIFRVRASDGAGIGSSASHSWTIDLTPPVVTIDDPKPKDGSPGDTVTFFFHASEGGVTFECSLATGAEPDVFSACVSGKTYMGLPDGEHTFKAHATDAAGNPGNDAEHIWTVDNSAPDTEPPETFIDSAPPNPSGSSTALFAYHASEPGSSFECTMDGAAFAGCPATGIAYTGLANGSHTFQVRARDGSGNIDESPAGYTFDVAVPSLFLDQPPALPPTLEPDIGPGTAVAAAIARVRGTRALLGISCRGQQGARCSGVLRLVVPIEAARSSRRGARNLTIGRTRYSLPVGGSQRIVGIGLTREGSRLVRRAGRRGLKVRLVGTGLKSRILTLRTASGGTRP